METPNINTGIIAVEKSSNSKIGPVSATSASQTSCPETCPWMGSGCYAESGLQGIHTKRLNKSEADAIQLAKNEAEAIKKLSGKRPLRLHVVGDAKTNEAAEILSDACGIYANKHSNRIWSYTHSWGVVERSSWNNISIIASVESISAARLAMEKGYAAAIVVDSHKDSKSYIEDGIKFIPCPEQTGKASNCTTCKLCWNDQRLLETKSIIAFAAHSQGSKKIKEKLVSIGV